MLVGDNSTVVVTHVLSPANCVKISLLFVKMRKRPVILDPKHNGARLMGYVVFKLVCRLIAFKNCGLICCPVDLDLNLIAYFVFPAITNTDIDPAMLNLNNWWLRFFIIIR